MSTPLLDSRLVQRLVEAALAEDRAAEDVTTAALVPPDQRGRAAIVAKAEGVLAGLTIAEATFRTIDPALRWRTRAQDGETVRPGEEIAEIEGALASILRAERAALNFLCHLSGVATAANRVVRRLDGTSCRLRDTRKTTPGLRSLEKYAVRVGGGENHRLDLADGILIKDNHLAALRRRGLGIIEAVRLAAKANPAKRIEIEVTNLQEAREALEAGADELLLDNMSPDEMRKIAALVSRHSPRPALEASGGITLENVRDIAETGVDYVSMGALTHSAPALDISLEVEPA